MNAHASPPPTTRPPSGACKPASSSRSVDLPQPDGPTTATDSPAPTRSSTPSSAVIAPKRRTSPSAVSAAVRGGEAIAMSDKAPFAGITPQVRRVSAGLRRYLSPLPRAPLYVCLSLVPVGPQQVLHLRLGALDDERTSTLLEEPVRMGH